MGGPVKTPVLPAALAVMYYLVGGQAKALDAWLDSVFGPPDTVKVGSIVRFGAYAVARYPATGRVYFRLDINGVRTYEDDENFDLSGGDSVLFDWPVICSDTGSYSATDSMGVYLERDDSIRVEWRFRVVAASAVSDAGGTRRTRGAAATTIVRGVLRMGDRGLKTGDRSAPSDRGRCGQLLDAVGRKVLGLRPGANDVSGLAPGVYFARSGGSTVSKIMITR